MTHDDHDDHQSTAAQPPSARPGETEPTRQLSPAALRALAEAEERRARAAAEAAKVAASRPAELGGRAGPDPVRYGDWEKGGIISDF